MRTWPLLTSITLALTLSAAGCASSDTASAPIADESDAQREDPTNPTAMQLHDLAGQLILFQVETGKYPAKLSQLDKRQRLGSKPSAIDPLSGKPYLYYPDGPRVAKLPGRLVVCQTDPQPEGGRWCLLINDYGNEGQVLTYVQRVDESVFERIKTGGGW
jgi:hypothetical protein